MSLRWWCWQTPIIFKGARADNEVSLYTSTTTVISIVIYVNLYRNLQYYPISLYPISLYSSLFLPISLCSSLFTPESLYSYLFPSLFLSTPLCFYLNVCIPAYISLSLSIAIAVPLSTAPMEVLTLLKAITFLYLSASIPKAVVFYMCSHLDICCHLSGGGHWEMPIVLSTARLFRFLFLFIPICMNLYSTLQ